MPDLSTFTHLAPYHILSYGTLLGTQVFQSFIGGVMAFKTLPRPAFSTLQAGIFPVYFTMQTALPVILALTYPGRKESGLGGVLHDQNRWAVLVPLTTIFLGGLANLTIIGPATTKVMRDRKSQEYRDGKKSYDPPPHSQAMQKLNKKFGMLHGISSLVNLAALLATVWYGGSLAEMLM